ncbi:sugar kinase [Kribbella solani]|uniref:2-dehydro-3-deoxygluconokinase n=1 Tax=Kribbella solani TaxID=236067 RepID=A0A841E0K9_9ACTN|nr:sugar kinase [Kribbella solani]MBB5983751.1 2-dehydro-3-deoxygluconokinase [Kribbella solani]
MTDLLTLGETMVSVRTARPMRLGGDAHLSIAGSESNVAIGVARLGHHTTWLGALGNDEPGRLIQRTLRAENVDTSQIRFADDSFTGFIAFDQPSHDITRVSYHRRGSAASTLTPEEATAAIQATKPTLLHVTGITPALSPATRAATLAAVRAASAAGTQVSLDVNYRARLWSRPEAAATIRELLPYVHTIFASDDELDLLTDAPNPVPPLLEHATQLVVTAGHKGAWLHTRTPSPAQPHTAPAASPTHQPTDPTVPADKRTDPTGAASGVHPDAIAAASGVHPDPVGASSGVHTIHQPALSVTVVDSIGAGDAFVSGYLSATLDDLAPEARLHRATTSGAFCVTAFGDWESLPTRQDLSLLTHTQGTALR